MKQPKSAGFQKVTKKVHANINFSKLDEVCLDVGKVDLSHSARMKTDMGLSPHKYPDVNGRSANHARTNGHVDLKKSAKKNVSKLISHNLRECYVQLEGLVSVKGSKFSKKILPAITPKVERADFDGPDGFPGWKSKIDYVNKYNAHAVIVGEDFPRCGYTLVFTEDLNETESTVRNEYSFSSHCDVNNAHVPSEAGMNDSFEEADNVNSQIPMESHSSDEESDLFIEEIERSDIISVEDASEVDNETVSEDGESQEECRLCDEFVWEFRGWTIAAFENAKINNENYQEVVDKIKANDEKHVNDYEN